MKLWRFLKSFRPVLIALPHSGSFIPPEIAARMTDAAKSFSSPAEYLLQICECTQLRDAGLVASNVSPLVVDLTRPLPGAFDPSLETPYPTELATGQPIYLDATQTLNAADHQLRRTTFYLPFFQKLSGELDRMEQSFGTSLLILPQCVTHGTSIELAYPPTQAHAFEQIKTIAKRPLSAEEIADHAVLNLALSGTDPSPRPRLTARIDIPWECFTDDNQWSTTQSLEVQNRLAEVIFSIS